MEARSGIPLLLEETDGRWVAHLAGLPGCFANGATPHQAMENVPQALERYASWRRAIGRPCSIPRGGLVIEEMIRAWQSEPGYEVNAFFAADRPPLQGEELELYECLLAAARADLLAAVEGLTMEQLQRPLQGERWPMEGVLGHVALAEWWYLDRMGLAPSREGLPETVFLRLEWMQQRLLERLPQLAAKDEVCCRRGELWSARKVLRRALWHARDHTAHLLSLRARVE